MALGFGALIIFLFVFIEWQGKEQMKGCEDVGYIKVNSDADYKITYCKDNGKVLDIRDSTWVEPSEFQKRWIETKKVN